MANFAQLDENNIVINVISVSNVDCSDSNGIENEEIGVSFCKELYGSDTKWKQTSVNKKIRKRYAGIGFSYNEDLDAFLYPQPYPSWIIDNDTFDWVSPLGPAPALTDEQILEKKEYFWDEDLYQSDNTSGWILRDR